ncbi:MAG TPA: dTDP-4-dehydrorhamnose reductase [Blastocatellia bacterium]|nr:dTDP-4-dehydrorhamnose reductase [Blastocatellia bacterium]
MLEDDNQQARASGNGSGRLHTDAGRSRLALVTGAGGLLGRAMTQCLTSGWRTLAMKRAELDITREDEVQLCISHARPDVVINCAALADVDRCETDAPAAFEVNERGPRLLARACRESGAELVHISTDYVFDGEKDGFYTQEDPPHPLSSYAGSKLAGEMAVRDEAERFYIVRSSWIFGLGGKNFGSRVIDYARQGRRVRAVTDQTSIPTYAPDLARRIETIIEIGARGLYHVTNSGPATWYDFARVALDLAGLGDIAVEPVTRDELGQPAVRPRNSAMRCLVSERLGLRPLRHWREALAEFVSTQ